MPVKTDYIELRTRGDCEIVDITPGVAEKLGGSGMRDGTVTVFCPGATGGVTTVEYEPGLVEDIPELFEKLIADGRNRPEGQYHHDRTWHDGNGHSHLRATLLGPSLTIPFVEKQLTLGTWQQIIFIDFDNKPHRRKLVLQFIGE